MKHHAYNFKSAPLFNLQHALFFLTLGLSTHSGLCLAKPTPTKAHPKLTAVQTRAIDGFLKAADALSNQGKEAQALAQYQKALKISPDDIKILWPAAATAFNCGQIKFAATYLERSTKSLPDSVELYSRLIQAYQKLEDVPHREAARKRIIAIYLSGKDKSVYTEDGHYIRDMFAVGDKQVLAFENFVLHLSKGDDSFAVRYDFLVFAPDQGPQDDPTMRLEVGWNFLEKDRKGGYKPAAGIGAFYFDAYYSKGAISRKTFGLLAKEPSYDACRQVLIDIVNGKARAISSHNRSNGGT